MSARNPLIDESHTDQALSNVLTLPGIHKRRSPQPQSIGEWVAREMWAAIDLINAVEIPDELRGDALVKIIKNCPSVGARGEGV